MIVVFNLLTTREWTVIIWGLFLLPFILLFKETRKALVKIVLKKLLSLWVIILVYTAFVTYFLSKISLWKWIYLKDVIIFIFTCAFFLCINSASKESDETYLKKTLMDNLKIMDILEFELDYTRIHNFNFNNLRNSMVYSDVLVGPIPHRAEGIDGYSSFLAMADAHPEEFPKIIKLQLSNELKITKESFRNGLQNTRYFNEVYQ